MKKKYFTAIFCLIYIVLCKNVFAEDILERVEKAFSETQTFQADFIQEANNIELDMKNTSRGKIFLSKKPSQVRWNYTSPDVLMFLLTDNHFLYYSEEDNQVVKRKTSENAVLNTPVFLLAGKGKVSEKFKVDRIVHDKKSKLFGLLLIPKESSESYKKIILGVDDKECKIQKISIVDLADNRTSITFLNQKINAKLPEKIFDFQIPKDAEVITNKDLAGF